MGAREEERCDTVASPRTRVRAFDGIRGLAVIAVVCFHAQFGDARGGFLGVSAFFTLSGYLITSLLLGEHRRTGRLSLRGFWSRRARRLLPAAYLAIGGVLAFGATVATVDQLRSLRDDVFAALAYVANWRFYLSGRSYAALFSAPSPVLHFWSLAIEEQFYIVFPLLVLAVLRIGRARRAVLGAVFAAATIASIAASVVLAGSSGQSRVYYGTDTRAAELLIGALLAVVLAGREVAPRRARDRVAINVLGAAALSTMIYWWVTVDQTDAWLYHGGFALHALLTAVVIVTARAGGPLARALAVRPLEFVGRISYGVYLFHWPIFLWLSADRTGLSTAPLFALRVTVTLAVTLASYSFVEQPVLRGRAIKGPWPKLVTPATAAALAAVLLVVTASPPAPEIVLRPLDDSALSSSLLAALPKGVAPARPPRTLQPPPEPKPKVAALYRRSATARPLRILVVGDSVGLTLGRGMQLWARQHGDARVVNLGHVYCPLGRDLPAIEGMHEARSTRACDWTSTWQSTVGWFDPDVTLVLFTVWEAAPRKLPGASDYEIPGQPALDAWQLGEYQAAADTLGARGGQVVWFTVPCEAHVDIDKKNGLWYVNERTIPRLAASRPFVHVLDLHAQLCDGTKPVKDFNGVANFRPDGAHFSDAGALAVANWFMPIVLGQAPAPAYPREP